MSVILQGWFRSAYNATVPAPVDKETPNVPWWYDHLAEQANYFAQCGFDAVLLPPVGKTTAGSYTGADGYGCYDEYDLGNKNQYFSKPTRFGPIETLQRVAAVLKANGIDTYLDLVLHQRMGGMGGNYRYLGADGKTFNGRYSKTPGCFIGDPKKGYSNRDDIAGPIGDDFSFGDELVYQNCQPPNYTIENAIANADWMTKYIGAEGYRIDDTKGLNIKFVHQFLTSKIMADKFAVGEYYDGNADTLNWWIWDSGMEGRAATFDFHFHFAVANMCNNTSRWDMRQLYNVIITSAQDHKVKFVENPDTDTSGFASVIWNKAQGYFLGATTEGDLMVYYRDWSKEDNCYGWGLQESINNYIWVKKHLANGGTQIRFADYQAVVYERTGHPGLLCAINNDEYNNWRSLWVQTNFGANVELHDVTGHAQNIWTNNDGWTNIWIPPNINGLGTVAYTKANQDFPSNIVSSKFITQEFAGAEDLDINAIINGEDQTLALIWVQKSTPVDFELYLDADSWDKTTDSLDLQVTYLSDLKNSFDITNFGSVEGSLINPINVNVLPGEEDCWVALLAIKVIVSKPVNFWCKATYKSTQTITKDNYITTVQTTLDNTNVTDKSYSVKTRIDLQQQRLKA